MKAWVLHDVNDLRLETVEKPTIKAHEVLVEVKASGVCGSDIQRLYGTGTYSYPLIPGHEFSGIVIETGAEVDDAWKGRHVGIFPLIPCESCNPCRKKQYEMCRHYDYLGSRRDGGFAEYVAVPEKNLVRLPDGVAFEEAAMLEPMAVAVHAMRRMSPKASDTIAICGLGTIGLLLLMFLREAGIENIFLIGNKEYQEQIIKNLKVPEDRYFDSRTQDVGAALLERTEGIGADLFFECVGSKETIAQTVQYTAPGGEILLLGSPDTDICLEKNLYGKILRNQLTIRGSWNSSFRNHFSSDPTGEIDDWEYVLERLQRRSIAPAELISHRLSLEELETGLHIMRDKTEDYVKIMRVEE